MPAQPSSTPRFIDAASFGESLTALRVESGLSVRALAQRVELPTSTLGGWLSGRHLPYLRQMDVVDRVLAELSASEELRREWTKRLRDLLQPAVRSENPYLGLASFEEQDRTRYFGRERLVVHCVSVARATLDQDSRARMMVVTGASGSGKSSLIKAGLVPALRDSVPHGAFTSVVITPGLDPLHALQSALLRIDQSPRPGPHECVVVVDQLDELFTHAVPTETQAAFLGDIMDRALQPDGPLFVLAVRADFYGHLTRQSRFAPILEHSQVVVSTMSEPEIRATIECPPRQVGVDLEIGLADAIVREFVPLDRCSAADEGSLPLLSHCLELTWQASTGNRITLSAYHSVGGVAGATALRAEQAYEALSLGDRAVARELFLAMLTLTDDGIATRYVVNLTTLMPDVDGGGDNDARERVLDHFVNERLLTATGTTIQLSHEVLLRAWPRLRDWIDEDQSRLVQLRQLREAHRVWRVAGCQPSDLLTGSRFAAFEGWLTHREETRTLNAEEREFIAASRAERARLAALDSRRRRKQRRLAGAALAFAIVASAAFGFAVRAQQQTVRERNEALSRKGAALSEQVRLTDSALAAQLAVAAYRTSPTVEARSAAIDSTALPLPTRLIGAEGETALSATAGGRVAISDASDGSIRILQEDSSGHLVDRYIVTPSYGMTAHYYAISLSPDGEYLVGGNTEGAALLWKLGDEPTQLSADLGTYPGAIFSVAFRKDGDELAIGSTEGVIQRFDMSDPLSVQPLTPVEGFTGVVKALAYAPTGYLAAGDSSGLLRMFQVSRSSVSEVWRFQAEVDGDQVHAAAFSALGNRLAVGYRGRKVRVWDTTDPARPIPLEGPVEEFGSWVNAVGFNDDGSMLVAASSDSTTRTWRTSDWKLLESFPSGAPVTAAQFSLRDILYTTGIDGVVHNWPVRRSPLPGAGDSVWNMTLTADGSKLALATGSRTSIVPVWNVADPNAPVEVMPVVQVEADYSKPGVAAISPDGNAMIIGGRDGASRIGTLNAGGFADFTNMKERPETIEMAAFAPSGRLAAVGSDDGSVMLIDTADPTKPRIAAELADAKGQILNIAFHPELPLLAVSGSQGNVYFWNIADLSGVRYLGFVDAQEGYSNAIAFSSDGRILAASGTENVVRLWRVDNADSLPVRSGRDIRGPRNSVFDLKFQPGTYLLAGAVQDGTAWIWDLADIDQPAHLATLTAPSASVSALAFSSDGDYLFGGGRDGLVYVWEIDVEAAIDRICGSVGDAITEDEWTQYLAEVEYQPPCA